MRTAGFVLVGGESRRMGRDKALLLCGAGTVAARTAKIVEAAAGSAVLIGSREKYGGLGWPVWPDMVTGQGPIGGLLTLLNGTQAEWNLVAACDLPGFDLPTANLLLREAFDCAGVCVVSRLPSGGLQPLCAVYHRDCLPVVQAAVESGRRRMADLVASLDCTPVDIPHDLGNWNYPEDVSGWNQRHSVTTQHE